MATFDQIKETRLQISDPAGFIDFMAFANFDSLPDDQVTQTAYKTTNTGEYWYKPGTDYVALRLRVADSRLSTWIDSFGINGAVRKSIEAIIAGLPAEMMIVENGDGAERTKYLELLKLQEFYENFLDRLTPVSSSVKTGIYIKTKQPCIAGGNV